MWKIAALFWLVALIVAGITSDGLDDLHKLGILAIYGLTMLGGLAAAHKN